MSAKSELIQCVRKYRSLDDKLKDLNKEVYKLREERKIIELEMSDLLKVSQFATINKLEINDDKSVIKIQRPDMWSKPWSLSAKDLKQYLEEYFRTAGVHTAEGAYSYVVEKRKAELVASEFAFSRVSMKEEDES
jgi:predicted nuclease with TOPRIM domain